MVDAGVRTIYSNRVCSVGAPTRNYLRCVGRDALRHRCFYEQNTNVYVVPASY
jgi:hypothetical protein